MNSSPELIAIYDACVLYPAPLRDLLIRLGRTGLFRARWTEAVHDEWIRNVLADRPDLSAAQLERTRQLMNAAVRDCLVIGYEGRIDNLTLPDPDDRHVLAAAIEAQAQVIVTYNLRASRSVPAKILFSLAARHLILTGKPLLIAVQVCPLSVERKTPLLNVPANRLPPLITKELTDKLGKPLLIAVQLCPLSVERNTPFLATAKRLPPLVTSASM